MPRAGRGGGGALLQLGGGGSHVRVCCAVLLCVRRAAPLRAAHYTAPHPLCCTALLCALRCTLCAVPHRTACAVPHYIVLSPTPVLRARQHSVEGTVGLVPAQPTSAPSTLEGRWGCCTSYIQAATHVLQPL